MRHLILVLMPLLALACWSTPGSGQPAGFEPPTHGFFTALPKLYGRLEAIDPARREMAVTLEEGGRKLVRPLRPDVDVFAGGGFGRLSDLAPGERVWVVFDANGKEPAAVRFIADEIGIQTIHGDWFAVERVEPEPGTVTLAPAKRGATTRLRLPVSRKFRMMRGAESGGVELLRPGDRVRYQTWYEDGQYRLVEATDEPALARAAGELQKRLAQEIAGDGIPGEVAAVGPGAGEATLLLYRPGGDAARDLEPGMAVRFDPGQAPAATVRRVEPWGEKTRLTVSLPTSGPALDRKQPVRVFLPPLPSRTLPPGIGRAKEKNERIEWILATVYCTCRNGPDVCTGHLYTLSMCDAKGCGMPEMQRAKLGRWIDAGMTDEEILAQLEREEGALVRRPHLVGRTE